MNEIAMASSSSSSRFESMDLTILSNDALEYLADDFNLAGDWDAEHLCVMEMGRRGHFPTAWLDDLAMAGF